jgi:hypothetical protein
MTELPVAFKKKQLFQHTPENESGVRGKSEQLIFLTKSKKLKNQPVWDVTH